MTVQNKYLLGIALATNIFAQPAKADKYDFDIELGNNLSRQRTDCPVAIRLSGLNVKPITAAVVTDGEEEIPCQLDDLDGDGVADEVAFVVDIPASATRNLTLTLHDDKQQKEYAPRVWADFMLVGRKKGEQVRVKEVTVPGDVNFYNMVYGHGPMFESELVGYRVYFNQKQTLDPYGKFSKRLELADTKFYPNDEYLAKGYGDDVLFAGNSCGVGAFKGWDGKNTVHVEPVATRSERLIATGPVRTIVEVEVNDWDYQGDKLDMVNRYTLYAGHRDLQVDVEFAQDVKDKQFATGVERIRGDETKKWSDGSGTIASWGRHFPVTDTVKYAKETIGIATAVPMECVVSEADAPEDFLYVIRIPDGHRLKYHTMFTSKKETFGYEDSDEWFAYLPKWREELENEVTVKVIEK